MTKLPKSLERQRKEKHLLWATSIADSLFDKDDPIRNQISTLGRIPFEDGFNSGAYAVLNSPEVLALVEALKSFSNEATCDALYNNYRTQIITALAAFKAAFGQGEEK